MQVTKRFIPFLFWHEIEHLPHVWGPSGAVSLLLSCPMTPKTAGRKTVELNWSSNKEKVLGLFCRICFKKNRGARSSIISFPLEQKGGEDEVRYCMRRHERMQHSYRQGDRYLPRVFFESLTVGENISMSGKVWKSCGSY
jgi:hypothetical protein